MRIHHLMALYAGMSLLTAHAQGIPPTQSPDATRNASVRDVALRTLETGESPEALEQAVATLASLPNVNAAEFSRVAEVSRAGADDWTRISAIRVMQRWLARESLRVEAARELLRTAKGPHSPMVRGVAVQAIALKENVRWPEDVVVSLGELVQNEPTAQNRAIAALALGHVRGELAGIALKSLVTAYGRESDIGTRRAMLLNIVEVARGDAARVLQGLPERSGLVRQDIQDYQELLRTGVTDIAGIWDKKLARDIERGSVIGTEAGSDRD
jgi:hypothetical protein